MSGWAIAIVLIIMATIAGLNLIVNHRAITYQRAEKDKRARFLARLPTPVRAVVETTNARLYHPTAIHLHKPGRVETCTAILGIDGESFYIEGILDVPRPDRDISAILLKSSESTNEILLLVAYVRWGCSDDLLDLLKTNTDLTIEWEEVPYGVRIDNPAEDPCGVRVEERGVLARIRVSDLDPIPEHAELGTANKIGSTQDAQRSKSHPTISA